MASISSSSPRITLFLHSFTGGGAEKMMINIANELYKRGYNIELVLANPEGPYESLVDPSIKTADIRAENIFRLQYNLWRYLNKTDTDVLLSTMEIPNIVSIVATRAVSIPVILRIANINSMKERHGKYRLIPALKRITYPQAESIVTISDGVSRDIVDTIKIRENKTRTIYNPAFTPDIIIEAREKVDHEWLNDDNKQVVIGVGNLKPQKDFLTLLKAIDYFKSEDIYLIILGEGNLEEQLLQQAESLGVDDRISLPGFVNNPYKYIAKADVFALSSAWEGFGNVIVEAMACGTPVVCTDCPGGPAEILDSGTYGPLVPVGDSVAMAEAIQELLENPTDPDLLISRAKDFSIEEIVDQYEEEILSVINQSE